MANNTEDALAGGSHPPISDSELELKIKELGFKISELERFDKLDIAANAEERKGKAREQELKVEELNLRIQELKKPAYKKLSTYTSLIAVIIALLGVLGQYILSGIKTENAKREANKITDAAILTRDSAKAATKKAELAYLNALKNANIENALSQTLRSRNKYLIKSVNALDKIFEQIKDKVSVSTARQFSKVVSNVNEVSKNIQVINPGTMSGTKTASEPENNKQPDVKKEVVTPDVSQQNVNHSSIVVSYPDDPQRGKWGEHDEVNSRKLWATVDKTRKAGQFKLTIIVESIDSRFPLNGAVTFHLHNTYVNQNPVVPVVDGKAILDLSAYGAFTVGAEADNGKTRLEYNLVNIPNAPEEFKNN